MKKLLSRATKSLSVSGAATLLIATTLIGQVLGFLRLKFINANFSAVGDESTDAFFAAFKIPDFFFLTIAAGALGVAFIPFLSDRFAKGDRKGAWQLSSSLLNILAIVMGVVGLLMFIFAQQLISYVVAPDLNPAQLENAVTIMRLIALNPLLFTISGILMSMQQTMGRFFFYAAAPLFYNVSIIISIFVFRDNIGIVGLGIGAFVGAVFQLLIAVVGMFGTSFKYEPVIRWRNSNFRGVLRLLPARSVDQGVNAINSIAETNFARRLGEGFITYYENAFVLHTAPILLIGTTISTAAFPKLTSRLSQKRPDLFRRDFQRVLRAMIWIALPVIVVAYFSRGYLARLIFARDAPEIALIFGFLCGAIFFRIIYQIMSRYFYANKDTFTPLVVSVFTIGFNIYLAYTLSRPDAYGVAGLALAQTIAAGTQIIIVTSIMFVRDKKIFAGEFLSNLMKIFSVTGFAIVAAYIMITLLPLRSTETGFIALGSKLSAITLVTFGVYIGMSLLFRLDESQPIKRFIKRVILKPIRINW